MWRCCPWRAGGCSWRLIDLDAATPIGEVVGTKWSTAYNPPEILFKVPPSLLALAGTADYGEDGTVRATERRRRVEGKHALSLQPDGTPRAELTRPCTRRSTCRMESSCVLRIGR